MKWLALVGVALVVFLLLAIRVSKALKRARIEQFGKDADDE